MRSYQQLGPRTLAGLILVAGLAHAQNAAFLASLQAESNFSSWPGQSGPVQGFNFQPSQYGALTGFSISSSTLDLDYLTYGLTRTVQLSNGSGVLTLTIGVGQSSVTNGHTLFLVSDSTNRDLDYFTVYFRGDQLAVNPVTAGDLNWVAGGADSTNLHGYLAFLRNNVFVVMEDSQSAPSGVNLGTLAAELDAAIQTQGTGPVTYAPLVINPFTPVTTTLSASAGSSTTATRTSAG